MEHLALTGSPLAPGSPLGPEGPWSPCWQQQTIYLVILSKVYNKVHTINLSTYIVTLRTRSTNCSLSSSRATGTRETGSTSDTSRALQDRLCGRQNFCFAGSTCFKDKDE